MFLAALTYRHRMERPETDSEQAFPGASSRESAQHNVLVRYPHRPSAPLAEIGALNRFDNPARFTSYSGLAVC